jgi:hypothetical protein
MASVLHSIMHVRIFIIFEEYSTPFDPLRPIEDDFVRLHFDHLRFNFHT